MLFKLSEVAKMLNVSEKTVSRRIKDGSLEAIKLSEKNYRISDDSLKSFIESRTTATQTEEEVTQ